MVSISTCPYSIVWFYQYQCHFDIWLHLIACGNLVKLVQMSLILNGSTCALSFNVISALCRVCASSLLYTSIGNLFLSAPFSLLMARHMSWHHWHQEERIRNQSTKNQSSITRANTSVSTTSTITAWKMFWLNKVLWQSWDDGSSLYYRHIEGYAATEGSSCV